jgi:uncharacterized membrane protein YjdF
MTFFNIYYVKYFFNITKVCLILASILTVVICSVFKLGAKEHFYIRLLLGSIVIGGSYIFKNKPFKTKNLI